MTDARHTGFWGQTGTGKSHEVKRRLAQHERVVVIDVNEEFWDGSTRRPGPLRETMTTLELRKYPRKLYEPNVSLAITGLDPLRPRDAARAVETVARIQSGIAKHTQRPPPRLLVVLDECGTYGQHCAQTLAMLATTGGQHLSITLWVIAQRPSLVPKTVRSQLKELVLFHMSEPGDLEAIEERTHSPGLSARVRALPEEFTPGKKPFVSWSAGASRVELLREAGVPVVESPTHDPEPVATREPQPPEQTPS